MSTWGKLTADIGYNGEIYYEYSTTTDTYVFKHTYEDEYTGKMESCIHYFGAGDGEAIMQGIIKHLINFDGLSKEQFVEKYINNNIFNEKSEN